MRRTPDRWHRQLIVARTRLTQGPHTSQRQIQHGKHD